MGQWESQWESQTVKRSLSSTDWAPTSLIPVVHKKEAEHLAEMAELSKQVSLSRDTLPSICSFSLYNTSTSRANSIELARDATVVAAAFDDSTVRVWDMRQSTQSDDSDSWSTGWAPPVPLVLRGHGGPVYACAYSPGYNNLLSVSEDGTARLWNLMLGSNLACYRGHNFPIWDVAYAPLEPYFATASHDRTARLWSVERGTSLRILAGHLSDVECVCFHPNVHYLASGSTDKCVRLWELRAGPCTRVLSHHSSPVLSLGFSPCGKYLASGGQDGMIVVWDLQAAKVAAVLKTKSTVWSLDYSACGKLMGTGHADGTVKLWDVDMSAAAGDGNEGAESRLLHNFATRSMITSNVTFTHRNLMLAGSISR